MTAWLTNVLRFGWEWLRLVAYGNSWATIIAKWLGLVVGIVFALNINSRVGFAWLGTDLSNGENVNLFWQPTIGWLVLAVLVAGFVAVAFGMTWVRFRSLQVGTELETHGEGLEHFLRITNTGWGDAKVPVYAAAVADDKGVLSDSETRLAHAELCWAHHDPRETATLSRGIPQLVSVFKVSGLNHIEPNGTAISLAFCSKGDARGVAIGTLSTVNKDRLWIKIIVGHVGLERWFSIEPGDEHGRCVVLSGMPPFMVRRGVVVRSTSV